jgi:hypothetical protein
MMTMAPQTGQNDQENNLGVVQQQESERRWQGQKIIKSLPNKITLG